MMTGSGNWRLEEIIRLSLELAQVRDLDVLLERILEGARQFVRADAGSIYIMEGGALRFAHAQNDTLSRRLGPGQKLIYTSYTIPADNQTIAGYVASSGTHLNLPDVYQPPPVAPFRFSRSFDELAGYHSQSMLVIPLQTKQGRILGVLQLINALNERQQVIPFQPKMEPFVQHFANQAAAALEQALLTRTNILRMISMAELRDPRETGAHVHRVAAYAAELYEAWASRHGVGRQEIRRNCDLIRPAAMLHDVGKVAITDLLLKKPARFTAAEHDIMKSHAVFGARLFQDYQSDLEEAVYQVALNHHERWDGTGYPGYIDVANGQPLPGRAGPDGKPVPKQGEEIPLFARLVAVADVYDALMSNRAYKPAWREEDVLADMRLESGRRFDPSVMEVFFELRPVFHAIASRYTD